MSRVAYSKARRELLARLPEHEQQIDAALMAALPPGESVPQARCGNCGGVARPGLWQGACSRSCMLQLQYASTLNGSAA